MTEYRNVRQTENGFSAVLKRPYRGAFGFGEKFDSCNQIGKFVRACVREKCFEQGEYQYLTMPFFLTPDGFGIYVETHVEVDFDFTKKDQITITFPRGSRGEQAKIWLFEGTPKEILSEFRRYAGLPRVFPKWVLGCWMSSNRWHTQTEIEEQLALTKEHNFPHSVLVVEPWSDHTTYYLFSGTTCKHKEGGERIERSDFDASQSPYYPDPQKLIDEVHAAGLKLLLWVVPSYAQGADLMSNYNLSQRLSDNEYVKAQGECVMNADGTPYEIPHTWCIGCMVPDFTNPKTVNDWFSRFSYLKEMGVDGFKTDGGEFIHDPTVRFYDGTTGLEGQNAFCERYIHEFSKFVGEKGIVFSRAGGVTTPCDSTVWAGDQESTWEEFASVIKAGLSAGLSGVNAWGFDIGGFAGYLPTKELYLRAVQAAAFVPVMQWHSEAVRNGRCDFARAYKINDRSPWNISAFHKDPSLLPLLRESFYLHYNLIPYQYALMRESGTTGIPPMRHLVLEFPDDVNTLSVDDEFMLGDALLIAPVLHDYVSSRQVYLPEGAWFSLFTGQRFAGGGTIEAEYGKNSPVFFRKDSCIPLNLNGGKLCSDVGSDLSGYRELTFLTAGSGRYVFSDDFGNEIELNWDETSHRELKNVLGTPYRVLHIEKDVIY